MKKFLVCFSFFVLSMTNSYAKLHHGGMVTGINFGNHHGFGGFVSLAFPFYDGGRHHHYYHHYSHPDVVKTVNVVEYKNVGGGFVQDGVVYDSGSFEYVSDVKKMHDDDYVCVRGNIVDKLKDNDYLFHDSTGSITIEIDNDKWQGQFIGPKDEVEICGEVDKEMLSSVEIEAKTIRILKNN